MCLACIKFLLARVRRKSAARKRNVVHPRSVNASTHLSSAQRNSSNSEVTVLMNQVQKSRANTFLSLPSAVEERHRRFSDTAEEFFVKSMEKRRDRDVIGKECLELYKEVSGVLILDHQLRQQIRRTPPPGTKLHERQNTW